MGLPVLTNPTATFQLNGGPPIEIRGLTRGEVIAINEKGTDLEEVGAIQALETTVIAFATGTPLQEVIPWYQSAPAAAVQELVQEIMKITGLTDLQKKLSEA